MELLKPKYQKKGVVIPTTMQLSFRAGFLELRGKGAKWRRRVNLGGRTAEATVYQ